MFIAKVKIWIFQNLKLVPVAKDQYGFFYDGDSYIVYAASEYGRFIGPGMKVSMLLHVLVWQVNDVDVVTFNAIKD